MSEVESDLAAWNGRDGSAEDGAVAALFQALQSEDVRALARAVSLVEDAAEGAPALLRLCRAALTKRNRALRIGITGPAGAGKSTLVDALTRELRVQGRRVGIVAVDPSSQFSGGAILGDRIRVGEMAGEAAVYMRSMATRGHLGGLARATEDVLTVIEAGLFAGPTMGSHGKDVLLVETTGVGQGEIEVFGLADLVAVVLVPGMGDSVQSLKAGVLEIASVFVLNKADREGVERLEAEIGEMLGLSAVVGGKPVPVVRTVATTGEGVAELQGMLDRLETARKAVPRRESTARLDVRSELDHIGIAVRSIAEAKGFYAALGLPISAVEEVSQERVRVVMMSLGESRIELLEATEPDSAVGRFLAKRGEGIHHIALKVPDLAGRVKKLKAEGIRVVSDAIQVGAGGHRYVFVHPSSANGVLIELVESVDTAFGESL